MSNRTTAHEPTPIGAIVQDIVHAGLRRWARGGYADEAAVELLIGAFDGRFATTAWPWIKPNSRAGEYWLDGEVINDHTGALSGGEQRVLSVVASLVSYQPLGRSLSDVISVDARHQDLVLAALAHAGGVESRLDAGRR